MHLFFWSCFSFWLRSVALSLCDGWLRFGGLYETTYTLSLRDGSRGGIYLADGCQYSHAPNQLASILRMNRLVAILRGWRFIYFSSSIKSLVTLAPYHCVMVLFRFALSFGCLAGRLISPMVSIYFRQSIKGLVIKQETPTTYCNRSSFFILFLLL